MLLKASTRLCLLLLVSLPSAATLAQNSSPEPLLLTVDASDFDHRVLRAVEEIPVMPGDLTLSYPQWLPGTHSTSFASNLRFAGLRFSANGQALQWSRDTIDPSAFHLRIPSGVSRIKAEFQFLTPYKTVGDQERVTMSADIVSLSWNTVVLYSTAQPVDQIPVTASLRLPAGFDFGSALEVDHRDGTLVTFKTADLDTLVDSPVLAGRHFKRFDLSSGEGKKVTLDVAGDRAEDLDASNAELRTHVALVTQARKLYGSEHYDHYDFLLSLSDTIGGVGLEHHQSSEDGAEHDYFSAWSETWVERDLLPHEYTHSWNGKFRRPKDLTTANFNVPMQDTLLWMYEGQTQFWGKVLAARSGMVTQEQTREDLALLVDYLANLPGRSWRNLQDTTNQELIAGHQREDWPEWQRSVDYYGEMVLVWLDADSKIRAGSHDRRSLDDFARTFFGVNDGDHGVLTYTFDDIVTTLNQIEPGDWSKFLRERLDQHETGSLFDGLKRSGWQVTYNDQPNQSAEADEKHNGGANFITSIGLECDKEGKVTHVVWNGAAYAAGAAPGDSLVAVNGRAYKREFLSDAILAAEHSNAPIELLLKDGDLYRTIKVTWHEGLHYPHLERVAGGPDYLSELLAPR
jgi:predicted metalloprotease with PDZ domain